MRTKRILGAHASVVQHDYIYNFYLLLLPFLFFFFPSIFPSLPPSLLLSFLHFFSSQVTEDYGALPATILTFDSSTTQHTVPVTIVNDDRAEPTETFTGQLTLMSPVSSRISVSPSQTTVSIEDNDSEE